MFLFFCLKQFDHDCALVVIINLMQLFLILMMIHLAARLMSRCDRKCQIKCGPGNFLPLFGFQLLQFMFLFCSEILAQFGISLLENAFALSSLHLLKALLLETCKFSKNKGASSKCIWKHLLSSCFFHGALQCFNTRSHCQIFYWLFSHSMY